MSENNDNPKLELGEFHLELKRKSFNDEKEMLRFVKKCVSMIRQTIEYKDWVNYIKDVLGHKVCMFTEETSDELTVEIHHHPMTLFDLVSIILNTYISTGNAFSSLDIIREVLLLHFNDHVGYIPMITSLHEKYHNGFLTLPPKFVLGAWNYLLVTPGYIIDDDLKLRVKELMNEDNNRFDQIRWVTQEDNT